MRIIALGDTHGRLNWKSITAKDDFDKVIFIGDYFDTHDRISAEQQMENFRDIAEFKKRNMDRVVLLFGNHDYHYLKTTDEKYSNFQPRHHEEIQYLLHKALDQNLLQMCHSYKNVLFVHAGITKTWCNANGIDMSNIERSINDLFRNRPNAFRFTMGWNRDQSGDDVCQSPIWVRPYSLGIDRIDNYIQVLGHTTQNRLKVTDSLIFIDTLGTSGEYLQIIDGVISATK